MGDQPTTVGQTHPDPDQAKFYHYIVDPGPDSGYSNSDNPANKHGCCRKCKKCKCLAAGQKRLTKKTFCFCGKNRLCCNQNKSMRGELAMGPEVISLWAASGLF